MKKKYYVGIAIIVVLFAGLIYGIYWNVKDMKIAERKNSIYYNTYYYSAFNTLNNRYIGVKFYEDGTSYLTVFDSRFNEVKDDSYYSKTEGKWAFNNDKEIILTTNNKENTLTIVSKDKINWEDGFGAFSIIKYEEITELRNSIYYNEYYYSELDEEEGLCFGIKFNEDGTFYLSVFDYSHIEVSGQMYSNTNGTWDFKNKKEILIKTNSLNGTIKIISKDKIDWEDVFGPFWHH